jgi:hypothetical protein
MVDLTGASDRPYTVTRIFFRSSAENSLVSGYASGISASVTYSFATSIDNLHKLFVQYLTNLCCKSLLSHRNGDSLSFDFFRFASEPLGCGNLSDCRNSCHQFCTALALYGVENTLHVLQTSSQHCC